MGGRSRRLRNIARRTGAPVAKGRGMLSASVETPVETPAPKKKKTTKKK